MTAAELIDRLRAKLPDAISSVHSEALDPFVVVVPGRLVEVALLLRDDPDFRLDLLNDVSGVDYLETDAKKLAKAGFEPHVEIVYHLSSFRVPGRRFTMKVVLPRWKDGVVGALPEVPSLAAVWATADWQEREVFDLVGVNFVGHPNLVRILTADDWVGHPLRKDYEFPLEYHDIRCR